MRAVVHDRYGPPEVLRLEEVESPTPTEGEVLVRVRASTVTQTDCHMRRARPLIWRFMLGFRRPKRRTLGSEFAGEVESVGAGVSSLAPGDRVFGMRTGAHAELLGVREAGVIAHMPSSWTFEEAAAVCDGAFQALGHLRAGGVGAGTRLLVYGASGSCGTAAVQIGRHLGAHVTAVCATNALELVRALGADEVIDYTQRDFTRSGELYDVILDAVGKHSFLRCRSALRPGGLFVATDGLHNIPLALAMRPLRRRKVVFDVSRPKQEDILFLRSLMEAGEYRAVIDRTYPLEDVVEANRYVDSWQKTGNVVLTVGGAAR